jgi:hypothetical protein
MQQQMQAIGAQDVTAMSSHGSKLIGRPVMIDPAFEDPQLMLDLIYRNSPYQQTASRNGNRAGSVSLEPWFRGTLAANEKPLVDGVEPVFGNPNFIAATKQSFQAAIVRPLSLTINLYAPMAAGKKHTDAPFFRGAMDRRLGGIRYAMGVSGLFQRWEVLAASAIAWFYSGSGGDLDYWPNGPDEPFVTINMPKWNVAMVSDNEHMFHRVNASGDPADYLPDGVTDPAMTLCRAGDGWEIRDTRAGTFRYASSQIRTSVLWKAHVFENEAAERAFDSQSDDLTSEMIVDIFRADLARRGVSSHAPTDLTRDPKWLRLLAHNYPSAYFSSANLAGY